jgi:hypothetical protein
MKEATGDAVLQAYNKCAQNLEGDDAMVSTTVSAGFLIPGGQKKGEQCGWQVFVKMVPYSDQMLAHDPDSGGLLGDL